MTGQLRNFAMFAPTGERIMKAIVNTKYGSPDVLKLQEVEKPAPEENEVLIKIWATTVSATDTHYRQADPFVIRFMNGLTGPKNGILGGLFAGEVEATGENVTLFRNGDQVFGSSNTGFGAHAEYICLPEDGVVAIKPEGMTYEEAAGLPEALTGLYYLRDLAKIRSGQKILINGASGGIGTFAVQLAKHFGAEVTGVCSTRNLEMVKSLGADRVIDYTQEDFTKNGRTNDIIFDTVGKSSFARCQDVLAENGIYLNPVLGLKILLQTAWTSQIGDKKAVIGFAGLNQTQEDLITLKQLAEAGQLQSVVDRCYPLHQAAEAHAYVEKGHKKGSVVLLLNHNGHH
jgi:NADPH:quinone reductase-like Zn-dependent oxidoreductase